LTKTSGQADVLKVLRLEAALTCSLSPTLQIPKHNLCNRITIELIKAHQIEEVKPNCTFQERADLEIPSQSHFIPVTDCVMAVYSPHTRLQSHECEEEGHNRHSCSDTLVKETSD